MSIGSTPLHPRCARELPLKGTLVRLCALWLASLTPMYSFPDETTSQLFMIISYKMPPFTDAPHLPDSPENPDNPEIPDSKVFILLVILFKSGQFRVIVQHIAMYR